MVAKSEQDRSTEILEQGNIYFLYRPKVRPENEAERAQVGAEDIGDVQNFYIVLKPQGGRFRLINVGRKRLPDIGEHERNWGFVDMVADSGKEIEETLQRDTYETKTRGERIRPAARPAGEGVYALVREGSRTHLAWALELPKDPGRVQKAFKIPEEASLAVSIANPEKRGAPRTAQLSEEQQADYPKVAAEGVPGTQIRDGGPAPARLRRRGGRVHRRARGPRAGVRNRSAAGEGK